MIYAPIMIPTLNRYKHLKKCLDSLSQNSWAKYTDVYIGLDFPPNNKYQEDYLKVIEVLNNKEYGNKFNKFSIIKREKNYGAGENSKQLRSFLLTKYDRLIRTDDDIEFSRNFIEYMDKSLDYFENDSNVLAVSGYSYPINWKHSEETTVLLEQISCPMWGIGIWKDKYNSFKDYLYNGKLLEKIPKLSHKRYRNKMIDAAFCDYVFDAFFYNKSTSLITGFTDVAMRIMIAMENKYIVSPVLSKSKNWGFDGSGLYCQKILKSNFSSPRTALTYNYTEQPVDTNNSFKLIVDDKLYLKENRKLLNKFDKRSIKLVIKAKLLLILYVILKGNTNKIIQLTRKLKKMIKRSN